MNSRFGSLLFIDNDCLVSLFDELFRVNEKHFREVISILQLTYNEIWIPGTVEQEFYLKRNDKKRKKVMLNILALFPFIRKCPIKVSRLEIKTLIGISESNSGEADALIQINKAKIHDKFQSSQMTFFSNDKGALRLAQNLQIEILDYRNLRNQLYESGIILP